MKRCFYQSKIYGGAFFISGLVQIPWALKFMDMTNEESINTGMLISGYSAVFCFLLMGVLAMVSSIISTRKPVFIVDGDLIKMRRTAGSGYDVLELSTIENISISRMGRSTLYSDGDKYILPLSFLSKADRTSLLDILNVGSV